VSTPPNALYCQAGGVTAVLNATAAAVIETCREHPDRIGRVFAGSNGILGVLAEDLIDTSSETAETLRALRHTPGGAFGSARFRLGTFEEDRRTWDRLHAVLAAHDIRYVLYNGGNGSADTTRSLAQFPERFGYPVTCIHVPKTVDNDLAVTDCSPGFGSAAKYLAVSLREAAADVASMAASSTKVFILEAMGRHAGWMVAAMGLAADADHHPPHLLLFAEVPFDPADFLARVHAVVERCGYCVVGASEGLSDLDGRPVSALPGPHPPGEEQFGGVAPHLARLVHDRLGYKCHWATADYLQRAARHLASATDLAHAEAVGRAAVDFALDGRNGTMPVIVRESDHPYRWRIGMTDLDSVATLERRLPRDFIAADRCHITASCRAYLHPLVAGESWPPFRDGLPVHARLAHHRVPRRLPPWHAS
jgi:ATP-dependent phosphofructokinase / diphosphate-dependent phosphofructokinase